MIRERINKRKGKIMKTLTFSMILLLMTALTACSSGDQEETTQQEQQAQQQESDIPYNFRLEMEMLLTHYLDLKNAVVDSDSPAAKEAAEELSASTREVMVGSLDARNHGLWVGISQILRTESEKLIASETEEEMRRYFENISTAIIRVTDSFDPSGGPYYLMECAEAETGDGQWISREEQIRNPYQTSADVNCGKIVEEL